MLSSKQTRAGSGINQTPSENREENISDSQRRRIMKQVDLPCSYSFCGLPERDQYGQKTIEIVEITRIQRWEIWGEFTVVCHLLGARYVFHNVNKVGLLCVVCCMLSWLIKWQECFKEGANA